MAPSQITIASSSLQRLIKEEASYHKELQQQEERLKKIETDTSDENQEFLIKQQKIAIQETQKLFPELEKKIRAACDKVQDLLKAGNVDDAEATKANDAVDSAKKVLDGKS